MSTSGKYGKIGFSHVWCFPLTTFYQGRLRPFLFHQPSYYPIRSNVYCPHFPNQNCHQQIRWSRVLDTLITGFPQTQHCHWTSLILYLFFFTWRNPHGHSLLLIIGNSRVVSDSYRLKLHDDHPTRVTGVLRESLTNYLSVVPPPLHRPLDRASPKNSPNCWVWR